VHCNLHLVNKLQESVIMTMTILYLNSAFGGR